MHLSQNFHILKNFQTSIQSQIVEHIIINKLVLLPLPAKLLAHQFAYRPTCSTSAAVIALEHHLNILTWQN